MGFSGGSAVLVVRAGSCSRGKGVAGALQDSVAAPALLVGLETLEGVPYFFGVGENTLTEG